jgi:hypothetical protein
MRCLDPIRIGDYRQTGCFPDAVTVKVAVVGWAMAVKVCSLRVSVAVSLKIVEASGTLSAGQVPEP